MILFFYDSHIQDDAQIHALNLVKKYADYHTMDVELFDLKFATHKLYQEYIAQFGTILAPMLCIDKKVVMTTLPKNLQEIDTYVHISSSLPCLENQIITYTS